MMRAGPEIVDAATWIARSVELAYSARLDFRRRLRSLHYSLMLPRTSGTHSHAMECSIAVSPSQTPVYETARHPLWTAATSFPFAKMARLLPRDPLGYLLCPPARRTRFHDVEGSLADDHRSARSVHGGSHRNRPRFPSGRAADRDTIGSNAPGYGNVPEQRIFYGHRTINRFEQCNGHIVAIGVVQGTLSRANRVLGTALVTSRISRESQLRWSSACTSRAVRGATPDIGPCDGRQGTNVRMMRVQGAQGCTPVQVNLGATNIDVLGAQVALDPIGITLAGAAGTPLGDLVCAASDLLGNVAGLVDRTH